MFLLLALSAANVQAKVKLPHVLGDRMILQQQTDVRLWGTAKASATVRVTVSWSNEEYSTKADKKGNFMLKVHTPQASFQPLSITFDDGEPLTLRDILAGEVWVCAGQSNMEMPMRGFDNCPVEGYTDEMIDAQRYKGIHYIKIPSIMRMEPQADSAPCQWETISSTTLANASATGYFFAQTVNRMLDVPVGLIMANKGGSRVESWLTRENLAKYTDEALDTLSIVKGHPQDYHRQLVWGNGTFNPILNYTIKGILYYQGCSNVGDPGNQYSERMKLLVEQWRKQFDEGEIPFYFVEIAPYDYGRTDGDWGAKLREQQYRAATIIPNSGLISTNDLVYPYEVPQIHPTQKRQVGQRLALLALNNTYGKEELWCKGASFKDMRIVNDSVFVHLKDTYGGISRLTDIEGFEVAGADKVFHPATAQHYSRQTETGWENAILVRSDAVKAPVAVRYCFKNFQIGNVKNAAGLPLFPFRTDDW